MLNNDAIRHPINERLAASVAALNAIASSDAALQDDLPALYREAQRVMQHMQENNSIALVSPNGERTFLDVAILR